MDPTGSVGRRLRQLRDRVSGRGARRRRGRSSEVLGLGTTQTHPNPAPEIY